MISNIAGTGNRPRVNRGNITPGAVLVQKELEPFKRVLGISVDFKTPFVFGAVFGAVLDDARDFVEGFGLL